MGQCLPYSKFSPGEYLLYSKVSGGKVYYIANIPRGNVYYRVNIPGEGLLCWRFTIRHQDFFVDVVVDVVSCDGGGVVFSTIIW